MHPQVTDPAALQETENTLHPQVTGPAALQETENPLSRASALGSQGHGHIG